MFFLYIYIYICIYVSLIHIYIYILSFFRYGTFYLLRVQKGLCWRKSFREIQQQGAIEVGGYRSRGLERAVLEIELPGDTAAGGHNVRGYKSRGREYHGFTIVLDVHFWDEEGLGYFNDRLEKKKTWGNCVF